MYKPRTSSNQREMAYQAKCRRFMLENSPCTPDCPDRCGGCRAKCERYAEYHKRFMEFKNKAFAEKQREAAITAITEVAQKRNTERT